MNIYKYTSRFTKHEKKVCECENIQSDCLVNRHVSHNKRLRSEKKFISGNGPFLSPKVYEMSLISSKIVKSVQRTRVSDILYNHVKIQTRCNNLIKISFLC